MILNVDEVDVDPTSGCWLWKKQTVGKGYGRKWSDTGGRGVLAHVWYWEKANGPVPAGLELDHLCLVKRCVNPDHLEPVSPTENRWRRSHLDREDVRAVRREGLNGTDAAARLGVSVTTGCLIVNRKTWVGVE